MPTLTVDRRRHSTSLLACLALVIPLLLSSWGAAAAPSAGPTSSGLPVTESLAGLVDLPPRFVENAGQLDSAVRFRAAGARYEFALTRERIAMTLRPDATTVRLGLRFVGSDPEAAVEGTDPSPARVSYLRGDDPGGWYTGLAAHDEVTYRDLWPGIDLHVRGARGQLKYEFHVAPGARPDRIALVYEGARGLAVADDGSLSITTPGGILGDAAPLAYQGTRQDPEVVRSAYRVTDGERYGFALGEYDASRPLVIDPAIDYATFLGGASHELGADVALDGAGNVYVTGTTQSDDFPTSAGAVDRTFNGGVVDVFVAKLTPDGSDLLYATYLGGTPTPLRRGTGDAIEHGKAIAIDASGNAYVAGQTTSSNFPTTPGAFQTSINVEPIETRDDATDGFVTKLGPSGQLVYSTFLGGTNFDDADNITVDGSGNALVAGRTISTNFPTTAGALQTARAGGFDGFVTKLNAAGSGILYSTYLGGADNETSDGIALAGSGEVVLAGSTRSADFPTTAGAFQTTHSGGTAADLFEVFVARLSPTAGSGLTFSTLLGGSRQDQAQGLALDAAENAYVVGGTLSPDFDTTAGAFDTTLTGSSEAFVTKLSSTGASLAYSTFLGGGGAADVAVTASGEAWVAGAARSGAPTTGDAVSGTNSGSTDAWLARLDGAGADLLFATFLGGAEADPAGAVALDGAGRVVVVGTTYSADFPVTAGSIDTTFGGDPVIFWGDAFVVRVDPEGTSTPPPPPPPAETETRTFTGELRRNATAAHTVTVGAAGPVQLQLDWARTRANVTLRALDPAGQVVFEDTSNARPKTGSYATSATGQHRIEVRNTTQRDTDYTLTVTYPVAGSAPPPPPAAPSVTALGLSPSSVTGGQASTGTVTLAGAAPGGGLSVSLSSSSTAVATVPGTVVVPAGQTSATFTVNTSSVATDVDVTISAAAGGATRSANLMVTAPSGPSLSSLVLEPTTVTEGDTSTGTVTLTGPAPAGGTAITLISSNTAIATVPPSVSVAAGSTSATFTVTTAQVSVDGSSAITARQGTTDRTVILFVRDAAAPPPAATLAGVSVSPTSVEGGQSSVGTVTLTGAAPAGGTTVTLSDNSPSVTVPASVTVAAGSTGRTFTVNTSSVPSSAEATITATLGATSRTVTLTVTPAAPPPPPSADTVTISRAEYDGGKNQLRVEASSSAGGATLTVTVTSSGAVIGTMSGGRGEFSWPTNPQNITVTSSQGGSASRAVQLK